MANMNSNGRDLQGNNNRAINPKDLPGYEILKDHMRAKLVESGDYHRLKAYLRQKLSEDGWRDDRVKDLKAEINEKGIDNVTVQDLYDKISVSGRSIDKNLEADMLNKIKVCYEKRLYESVIRKDKTS